MLSLKRECYYFADKKRDSGDGSGSASKPLVKYKSIGSGTKCKSFFLADAILNCYIGNEAFLPFSGRS